MTVGPTTVRTARSEDLDAILAIHAGQGSRPERPASELEEATWRRMIGTADLSIYVAEVDGRVVGTASLMLMPNVTYACAPTAFIEAVVVLRSHRRRGIATAMLQLILDDARAAGCNKVQLLSHKRHASDGAHRLYTTLGFEPEAEGFRLYLTGGLRYASTEARPSSEDVLDAAAVPTRQTEESW